MFLSFGSRRFCRRVLDQNVVSINRYPVAILIVSPVILALLRCLRVWNYSATTGILNRATVSRIHIKLAVDEGHGRSHLELETGNFRDLR